MKVIDNRKVTLKPTVSRIPGGEAFKFQGSTYIKLSDDAIRFLAEVSTLLGTYNAMTIDGNLCAIDPSHSVVALKSELVIT